MLIVLRIATYFSITNFLITNLWFEKKGTRSIQLHDDSSIYQSAIYRLPIQFHYLLRCVIQRTPNATLYLSRVTRVWLLILAIYLSGGFFVKTRYSSQSRSFSFAQSLSVSFENRNSRRYSVFLTGRGDARKIFRSRTFNLYHFPFRTLYDAIGKKKKKKRLMCAPYYRFFLACTDPAGSPFHSTQ